MKTVIKKSTNNKTQCFVFFIILLISIQLIMVFSVFSQEDQTPDINIQALDGARTSVEGLVYHFFMLSKSGNLESLKSLLSEELYNKWVKVLISNELIDSDYSNGDIRALGATFDHIEIVEFYIDEGGVVDIWIIIFIQGDGDDHPSTLPLSLKLEKQGELYYVIGLE